MNIKEMLDNIGAWPFICVKTSRGEVTIDMEAYTKQIQLEAYENAARICDDEKVSGETGTEGDIAYNQAIDHCVQSIRAAKDKL